MNLPDEPKSRVRWLPLVTTVMLLLAGNAAGAFVGTGSLGSIDYRVMAPDWICRGEVVSVLIVVAVSDQTGGADEELVATLTPPRAGFEAAPGVSLERRITLARGAVHRFAFTGWKARVDEDLGRFTFELRLASSRETRSVDLTIPVETIRGAAVPEGIWSILVPVAISLLALPVFALLIRRSGGAGAWRRPVDLEITPAEEAWWKA